MAKILNFRNPEEFEKAFEWANPKVADVIIENITEAFQFQKTTAHLFTINFETEEYNFEINLPRSQWLKAVLDIRDKYHKWDRHDDAIDAHLLMKQIKEWK
jgi:hypothetical protein